MRERLTVGEVARLVGVTPKTVRFYEKTGLLKNPQRSESGYRLYAADTLLRLHRVKKLRSLGLSLKQVGDVLGGADSERPLGDILKTLRAEVEAKILQLQERRERIEKMLSGQNPEQTEASPSFEKAMELLGEQLSGVSAKVLDQEKKFWSVVDAFAWPDGYDEHNEKLFRYYAEHPEEYRGLVAVGERLAALAGLPEDDPKVEEVAEGLRGYFEKHPPPGHLEASSWAAGGPFGQAMFDVTMSALSPAQRCAMALMIEKSQQEGDGV